MPTTLALLSAPHTHARTQTHTHAHTHKVYWVSEKIKKSKYVSQLIKLNWKHKGRTLDKQDFKHCVYSGKYLKWGINSALRHLNFHETIQSVQILQVFTYLTTLLKALALARKFQVKTKFLNYQSSPFFFFFVLLSWLVGAGECRATVHCIHSSTDLG
jgi:hypothetical protein